MTWFIFTQPTPGYANEGAWYKAYTPRPKIQTKAGFYDNAINTEVTTTAGFDLRYTLDGRNVSVDDEIYTGPHEDRRHLGIEGGAFLAPTPWSYPD